MSDTVPPIDPVPVDPTTPAPADVAAPATAGTPVAPPSPETVAADAAVAVETAAAVEAAMAEAAMAEAAMAEAAMAEAAGPGQAAEDEAAPANGEEHGAEGDEEKKAPTPPTSASTRARMRAEARARMLPRLAHYLGRGVGEKVEAIVAALESGKDPVYLGRFRRDVVAGLDERRMLDARAAWKGILAEEERRAELRELLASRAALTEELGRRLDDARDVATMEDVAAPWLPVTASRATVARGQGLQGLAEAIRHAKEPAALSDLAKPFVKEGTEIATLDAALAGARDIIAEGFCLDLALRARLREMFRRGSVLTVSLRTDRKGDAGRHGAFVGFAAPAAKVPPLKLLAVRRGERERVLTVACEPPEATALEVVHEVSTKAFGAEHSHAGFLRAAAEDGYRRILRPLLQAEVRADLKARADDFMSETFERSLRNLLLGPVGGPRRTLGLRPDVTAGHRVAAVDETGRAVYAGRLPHEATAGREVAVAALKELLDAHGVEVVAVGSGGGRKEALGLAEEAAKATGRELLVTEVSDGGTRALETAAVEKPVRTETGLEIGPEFVGALSLARRFQDPLAEYARLDARSLGLGPNVHDVHQGRLKQRLDDATAWCVAHVGPDATTAPAEVLAHVPGFDAAKARAFVAWRDAGGHLHGKAAIAGVEGVGLAAAEQAVGFLRVPGTADPRDRTQLHPEHYGCLDAMATQVDTDVAGIFRDGRLRARVDLGALATEAMPMPVWKHALWQATAGLTDPRPRFAVPMKPPPELTLQSLRPGLVLEGRVTRAVPFGVFLDVGLPADALVPLPHIGDRPGVDPAVVAPVGAVVQGRVLEVDIAKRRITLSMRSDVRDERRPRFDDRGPRGPRPDRGGERPMGGRPMGDRPMGDRPMGDRPMGDRPMGDRPMGDRPMGDRPMGDRPMGDRPMGGDRPAGGPPRFGADRPPRGAGGGAGRGRVGDRRGGERPSSVTRDRRAGAPAGAGGGRSDDRRGGGGGGGGFRGGMGGGGGGRDAGKRFDRDDPGAPRRISLPADDAAGDAPADEATLSPEQLIAKKLEEMKRRLTRPD